MSKRIKVADYELTAPLPDFGSLKEYAFLQLLLRWHGKPLGHIKVPIHGDRCQAADIRDRILSEHTGSILRELLHLATRHAVPARHWNIANFLQLPPVRSQASLATITVAVCTRDRSEDLALCLSSLKKLASQPLEILVIDNAPKTTATRELIERFFPEVRYVHEPRPGLDWARNRAIAEARGDILAYTDDDVVVDPLWTRELAVLFAENSDVMAVTGLVVPYELETDAQLWFEQYGGFGRGFDRKWYRSSRTERARLAGEFIGAGKFGTGANMAYRRTVFSEIGIFDPALDVGTVTQGGGDLDMFFRILKHGHTLVYEPSAIVRHRHRRDYAKLYTQIASNGIGFYSHLVRNAFQFPEERKEILKFGLRWLLQWNVKRWLKAAFKPLPIPSELVTAELRGSFIGLLRYGKAREEAKSVLERFGPALAVIHPPSAAPLQVKALKFGVAVRTCELSETIGDLNDVEEYFSTRLMITCGGKAIGEVNITNRYRPISAARLADEIVQQCGLHLLSCQQDTCSNTFWPQAMGEIKEHLFPRVQREKGELRNTITVSVVIATRDRPAALRRCLQSLTEQRTSRQVEIVVVDNNPASGLTRDIVTTFPSVRLVVEDRAGLSYARNTGFAASTGEILVCADDDIVAPPNWLEQLLAPFARNDVMLVTGNVFPLELETPSQIQFENYGGLGRGFQRREYDREWFDSFGRKAVPTWEIGATANAAVRASMLHDPAIGLLDEALGAGTPAGCSEDTYLFYKILKAGHTIVYEPGAYVWHDHRNTGKALSRQLFNYSQGHTAYHLTTFLRDGDARGLVRILVEIPGHQIRQLWKWICGKRDRSFGTLVLEIIGNLTGGFALWQSRRRVRELGPSLPYVPIELRRIVEEAEADKAPVQLATLGNTTGDLEVVQR